MKTTVELPDDLYRQAEVEAALRGWKLKDLIAEGLRLVLEGRHERVRHSSLANLMAHARGTIDSGTPNLASDPEHLADFGRHRRGHR